MPFKNNSNHLRTVMGNYNYGYYKGWWMVGYNINYIIQIGVRNDTDFNYLKSLYDE